MTIQKVKQVLCNPTEHLVNTAGEWNENKKVQYGKLKQTVGSRALCAAAVPVGLVETTLKGLVGVGATLLHGITLGRVDHNPYISCFLVSCERVSKAGLIGIYKPNFALCLLNNDLKKRIIHINKDQQDDISENSIEKSLVFRSLIGKIIDSYQRNYFSRSWLSKLDLKTRFLTALLIPATLFCGLDYIFEQGQAVLTYCFRKNKEQAWKEMVSTQIKIVCCVYVGVFAVMDVFSNVYKEK